MYGNIGNIPIIFPKIEFIIVASIACTYLHVNTVVNELFIFVLIKNRLHFK